MRKKESKIPLVLTLLILGYFIFWAFGYVARNQPARATPATLETPRRQALVDIDKPQATVQQDAPAATPTAPPVVPQQATDQVTDEPTIDPRAHSGEIVLDQKPGGNRKIKALAQEMTTKH